MRTRLLAVALAFCVAPFAIQAADEENPFKSATKGDFATYKMKVKVGQYEIDGTTTQTVLEKTDKEAKVKVTANVNGQETPAQEVPIDLTKPYDPTKVGGGPIPAGTELTTTKVADGKEKLKLGNKDYETTWTTYKLVGKAGTTDIKADMKVWQAKEVPLGCVKAEITGLIGTAEAKLTLELTEAGNKK